LNLSLALFCPLSQLHSITRLYCAQELHEKTLQLHTLESETHSKENSMRHEVSNTSQQVAALRDELERRLKDLVQVREERDALQVGIP
jgi:uncharacterized coiled-coil DUF342 family protein